MTLIISVWTPNFVVQVSDRRLSFKELNGDFCIADDTSNKLVMFSNQMTFGYTGLAYINGKKTDVWLTEVLANVPAGFNQNLHNVLVNLQEQATKVFRSINCATKHKRHAFFGVGWIRDGIDAPIFPITCRISNYHNEAGKVLSTVQNSFILDYKICNLPPYWDWSEIGANINRHERLRLTKFLKQCAKHRTGPMPVIRHFVDTIRRVAATDSTVGKNLLAVIMPIDITSQDDAFLMSSLGFGMFSKQAYKININLKKFVVFMKKIQSPDYAEEWNSTRDFLAIFRGVDVDAASLTENLDHLKHSQEIKDIEQTELLKILLLLLPPFQTLSVEHSEEWTNHLAKLSEAMKNPELIKSTEILNNGESEPDSNGIPAMAQFFNYPTNSTTGIEYGPNFAIPGTAATGFYRAIKPDGYDVYWSITPYNIPKSN